MDNRISNTLAWALYTDAGEWTWNALYEIGRWWANMPDLVHIAWNLGVCAFLGLGVSFVLGGPESAERAVPEDQEDP